MSDIAGPDYSKEDDAKTDAGMIDDTNRPEGAKSKVDITMSDKINKTPIIVSY